MTKESDEKPLEGRVVQLKGGEVLIANIGMEQGVRNGDRFLAYTLGEEIFDPEAGVSLGRLEQVKGAFIVRHSQQKMSQLTRLNDGPKQENENQVLSAVMARTQSGDTAIARIQVGDRLRLLINGSDL